MSPRQSPIRYGRTARASVDIIAPAGDVSVGPPSPWHEVGEGRASLGGDDDEPWARRKLFLASSADVSEEEHAVALQGVGPRQPDDFKRAVGFSTVEWPAAPQGERGLLDSNQYIVTVADLRLYQYDLASPATVGQLLHQNAQLRSLDLSGAGSNLPAHTVAALCAALETHRSLLQLDLHGLPAHPRCVRYVCHPFLVTCSTLHP
jgi:hypothetical protein